MEYHRICRKKRKVVQGCDVYISRGCTGGGWNIGASKWNIPGTMIKLPMKERFEAYQKHVETHLMNDVPELAFQHLGCWCKKENLCHAKILREMTEHYLSQKSFIISTANDPFLNVYRKPLYHARPAIIKRNDQQKRRKKDSRCLEEIKDESVQGDYSYEDDGKVSIISIITSPIVLLMRSDRPPFDNNNSSTIKYQTNIGINVVINPMAPPQTSKFDPQPHTYLGNLKTITNGFITTLKKQNIEWNPFVARVVKIIRQKNNGRFMLMLSEKTAANANSSNSVKICLGAQMFCLIENRFIKKNDIVCVQHYAISKIGIRKSVIIATEIKKVLP